MTPSARQGTKEQDEIERQQGQAECLSRPGDHRNVRVSQQAFVDYWIARGEQRRDKGEDDPHLYHYSAVIHHGNKSHPG